MRPTLILSLSLLSLASGAAAQGAAEGSGELDSPAANEADPPAGSASASGADEGDEDEPAPVPVVESAPEGTVAIPQGYGQTTPSQPSPQAPPAQPAQPAYGQPSYGGQQPGYGTGFQQPRFRREPYVEGAPLPPNAQVVTRSRKGLVIGGIPMFVASYVAMVFSWSFADAFGGDPPGGMLVPLIGPFFAMPDAGAQGRLLLAFDALLQIGGLTMFIVGLTVRRKYVEWYGDAGWRVTPTASTSGAGLRLGRRF